ncbi:unnamed protein product, partial [Symbiodinium sp. KB8]
WLLKGRALPCGNACASAKRARAFGAAVGALSLDDEGNGSMGVCPYPPDVLQFAAEQPKYAARVERQLRQFFKMVSEARQAGIATAAGEGVAGDDTVLVASPLPDDGSGTPAGEAGSQPAAGSGDSGARAGVWGSLRKAKPRSAVSKVRGGGGVSQGGARITPSALHFEPQPKGRRAFLHALAEAYGCTSKSHAHEPKRYVQVLPPAASLGELTQQGQGDAAAADENGAGRGVALSTTLDSDVTPARVVKALQAAAAGTHAASAAPAADGTGGGWRLPLPGWLLPLPSMSLASAVERYGPAAGGPTSATGRSHPAEPHVREMDPADVGLLLHLYNFKRLPAGGPLNGSTVGRWVMDVQGCGAGQLPTVHALDDRNAVLAFPSVGLATRALNTLGSPVALDKYGVPFALRRWGVGVDTALSGVPLQAIGEDGLPISAAGPGGAPSSRPGKVQVVPGAWRGGPTRSGTAPAASATSRPTSGASWASAAAQSAAATPPVPPPSGPPAPATTALPGRSGARWGSQRRSGGLSGAAPARRTAQPDNSAW